VHSTELPNSDSGWLDNTGTEQLRLASTYRWTFDGFVLCFVLAALTGLLLINPPPGDFPILVVVLVFLLLGAATNSVGVVLGTKLYRRGAVGSGGIILHTCALVANVSVLAFFLYLIVSQ